eukprot:CAMPEP_0178421126 /NCGR_PEP_ID=MMETSP0689_2-20121128/26488_1 /TAXON_ID=160604 /ORGANISM="Amphidinium massartii, Strain CS-259" /LENGTH=359 /DNA_ID=CAMNT_0020042631 /DNA_START=51 /DNA_END=1127 /DNA_ORIENTATION=+
MTRIDPADVPLPDDDDEDDEFFFPASKPEAGWKWRGRIALAPQRASALPPEVMALAAVTPVPESDDEEDSYSACLRDLPNAASGYKFPTGSNSSSSSSSRISELRWKATLARTPSRSSLPADVLATARLAAMTPLPASDDEEDKAVAPAAASQARHLPPLSARTIAAMASMRVPPSSFAMAQIAAKIPVPDSDDEDEQLHTRSLVVRPTQFFNLIDDDDELSCATTSCSSRRPSAEGNEMSSETDERFMATASQDQQRSNTFVEWLRWKKPYFRFEGNSEHCGWDWPLSKCEKRELLMLIMATHEQDARDGNEQAVHDAIAAAAPAPATQTRMISISRGAGDARSRKKLGKGVRGRTKY